MKIRDLEGVREMSTLVATVSMQQALTEEQLLSDLEESRDQIAAGQGIDMKHGLEEIGKI